MARTPLLLHAGYSVMAAAALICALALLALPAAPRYPVLGPGPLVLAVAIAAPVGLLALIRIANLGYLPGDPALRPRPLPVVAGLGAALVLPAIAIDLFQPFPTDTNVPLPQALVFYPAMALLAEVVFHLVPLALLLPLRWPVALRVMPVIALEPLFQVVSGAGPALQSLLVFLNVGLINAVQLWVLLRYGFGAMIGLRLVYYLGWHVLWGTLRLPLLF